MPPGAGVQKCPKTNPTGIKLLTFIQNQASVACCDYNMLVNVVQVTSDLLGQEVDSQWVFGSVGPQLDLGQNLQKKTKGTILEIFSTTRSHDEESLQAIYDITTPFVASQVRASTPGTMGRFISSLPWLIQSTTVGEPLRRLRLHEIFLCLSLRQGTTETARVMVVNSLHYCIAYPAPRRRTAGSPWLRSWIAHYAVLQV